MYTEMSYMCHTSVSIGAVKRIYVELFLKRGRIAIKSNKGEKK